MKLEKISPNIFDEYSKLTDVMMVPLAGNYNPEIERSSKPINPKQKQIMKQGKPVPSVAEFQSEYQGVVDYLTSKGIRVHSPKTLQEMSPDLYDQKGANEALHPRDSAFVVGDTFVIANLKEDVRKIETLFIKGFADDRITAGKSIFMPNEAIAEGGDIIVDGNTIYVGQDGLRTNKAALDFIKRTFGDKFNVVPIKLTKDATRQPILHLDCVFNPLSPKLALVYRDGISKSSVKALERQYELIDVDGAEQLNLGANFLSIGDNHVIGVKHNDRINAIVENHGFNVYPADIPLSVNKGGGVRCMTCPITRENER